MYERFTDRARKVMQLANQEAQRFYHEYIGTEHVLLGIVREGTGVAANVLKNLDVDLRKIRLEVEKLIQSGPEMITMGKLPKTPRTKKVIEYSMEEARFLNHNFVGTEHLLLGLIREQEGFAGQVLIDFGLSLEDLREETRSITSDRHENKSVASSESPTTSRKTKTPALNSFSRDLTELARQGKLSQVVGRDRELERISRILCCRVDSNILLVGEPGVGKSALTHGLAQRIVQGNVPNFLVDSRLCSVDLVMMVAGTKYRGQVEERWKALLHEIKRATNVILVFENLHLVRAYQNEYPFMISLETSLCEAFSRHELRCIGITSTRAHRKFLAGDTDLVSYFQKLEVSEPSKSASHTIAKDVSNVLGEHHRVHIDADAIDAAIDLSDRYVSEQSFPKKALQILDEAACRVRQSLTAIGPDLTEYDCVISSLEEELLDIQSSGPKEATAEIDASLQEMRRRRESLSEAYAAVREARNGLPKFEAEIKDVNLQKEQAVENRDFEKAASLRNQADKLRKKRDQLLRKSRDLEESVVPSVGANMIAEVVADRTGIPLTWLRQDVAEADRLLQMEDALSKVIIGQADIIEAVAKSFRHAFNRGPRPGMPLWSTLLLGPVGVGKNLLTETMFYFAFDRDSFATIDLANFTSASNPDDLLNAIFGYGATTTATKASGQVWPPSGIIFDHIESASPSAWRLVLEIIGRGRVGDANGRLADFSRTAVALIARTESLPAGKDPEYSPTDLSREPQVALERVAKALQRELSAQSLGLLDCILDFPSFSIESLDLIIAKSVDAALQQFRSSGFEIVLNEEVYSHLREAAQCETMGGHWIDTTVDKWIGEPLCEFAMQKKPRRTSRIVAELDNTNKFPSVRFKKQSTQNHRKTDKPRSR